MADTNHASGEPLSLRPEEYTVGWICATHIELRAAKAMLDVKHNSINFQHKHDENKYQLGSINKHNVVIAPLPEYGKVNAAIAGKSMQTTFVNLRFGLLVGVGGGIPSEKNDIRLGDIVVSMPSGTGPGVIEYDKGKRTTGEFVRTGSLNRPPRELLNAIQELRSQGRALAGEIMEMVRGAFQDEDGEEDDDDDDPIFRYPEILEDTLFENDCRVMGIRSSDKAVQRELRENRKPRIFYGNIGSGDSVIKDAEERSALAKDGDLICFEMEAAGLMNLFKCIVIRGICDYADHYKHKKWQPYAAAVAAAYAKKLLSIIPAREVEKMEPIQKYNLGLNLFDAPELDDIFFVGRESDFEQMEDILRPQQDATDLNRKVLVLGGMGGIGKTQLAIKYAKRYRTWYSSILWLNAKDEAVLQKSLHSFAIRVMLPEAVDKLDPQQVWTHLSNWLSETKNNRWLLIFDNYDDPNGYDIKKYYPSTAGGSIVVTTRVPDNVIGRQIILKSLEEIEDSLKILATRSGIEGTTSDPNAQRLAKRLDGHPLALATAGAFLKQSSLGFAKYLQQYEAKWQVIQSIEDLPDYPSRTLYTTWNLSFAQIEQRNPQAARLLRFFAYIDNQDIWYDFFSANKAIRPRWNPWRTRRDKWFLDIIKNEFTFANAMRELVKFCLVETHHQTNSYRLHVCVHDWTLNGLNKDINLDLYHLALNCVACHLLGDWDNLASQRYSRLVPHASRLASNQLLKSPEVKDLFRRETFKFDYVSELLRQKDQFTSAELILQLLLIKKERRLGAKDTSTLNTVHNLGHLYQDQGKLAEAEEMYQRALAGKEKALGPEHTSTLDTVNNLGRLYQDQGKLAEAEEMYQRALAGYENAVSPQALASYLPALNTMFGFGDLLSKTDRKNRAKEMYTRALSGYVMVQGPPSKWSTVLENRLQALEIMSTELKAGDEQTEGAEQAD